MLIKEIEYKATLAVRHRVLWPDKPVEFCLVDGDEFATHYGLYRDDVLIGVASLYESSNSVRLRKFAVDKEYQGIGFGSAILRHAIDSAKEKGASIFWCDARESAKDFYERFGLAVDGERFYKSNIPYFKMTLNL